MLVMFASHWEIFPLGGLVSDDFEELSFLEKHYDLLWHALLPIPAYLLGAFTVMTFLMKDQLMDNLDPPQRGERHQL